MKKIIIFVVLVLVLVSCTSSTSSDNSKSVPTIDGDENVILATKSNGSATVNLTLSSAKSVYFIFTNTSSSVKVKNSDYSINSNFAFATSPSSSVLSTNVNNSNSTLKLPKVDKLIKGSSIFSNSIIHYSAVGETTSFKEVGNENAVQTLASTCRKVVSNISTNKGNKTLNIWVADNCWETGGTINPLITQEMVNAMAEVFLKSGLNNDVYDWVTDVCGVEWGPHNYSNQISGDQPINILLCDIENDGANGKTCGYFWAGNNSNTTLNSNQKIMFYMDAPMYAKTTGTWSINGTNQRDQFTTLAHEFQHMINNYQLSTLKDVNQETWLDEMLAMSMEDLVAYNLYGDYDASPYKSRFADFNSYNDSTMCIWTGGSVSYGLHYALGSYLLRQYDGANLVKNIYASGKTSTDAVVAVTGVEFSTLMRYWGAAYLLSDKSYSNGKYAYNADLSSTCNSTYKLVPINAFSISTTPKMYAVGNLQNVEPRANIYYKAATNLAAGTYTINATLGDNLELTVVTK